MAELSTVGTCSLFTLSLRLTGVIHDIHSRCFGLVITPYHEALVLLLLGDNSEDLFRGA